MVYSGLFPTDGDDFERLRDALEKLRLNDTALVYEPETSRALGFGFRCGFGLLHMEIVRERLEREYDLDLVATAPSVAYRVTTTDGAIHEIRSPQDLPEPNKQHSLEEPYVRAMIIAPGGVHRGHHGVGAVPPRRARPSPLSEPGAGGARLPTPLADVVFDFFDAVKSRTRGYASLDYEPSDYRPSDLVRVDILLNEQPVDAFSTITHRDKAAAYGRRMVERCASSSPASSSTSQSRRPAVAGSSPETIKARRKDVTAKCYGGDITRKRKLLERQKGKKRMKMVGSVEVPQEAFIAALKVES